MQTAKQARMQELVTILNKAARAYYAEANEIMSNYEYDRLYDELRTLEAELGVTLSDSPTIKVGYETITELPKERHESPMLSLDKTKEVAGLVDFAGAQKVLVSWKLDGLTIVLTYRGGRLYKAVTRGNGEVGEVVTNNARVFKNLPLAIPYQGELILRGEAIITYSDFERINEEIAEAEAKYKNPRNLCSGSVRQLNNEVTAKRNVRFYAFTLVRAADVDFANSRTAQLHWLQNQGFTVVEFEAATAATLPAEVLKFSERIRENDFPSDGLVLTYDDIAYGTSLGRTSKFPRDSFAFKWADEIRETTLREIEWSPSRTGLLNPVAIFDPVELEGTTVTRASVHNLSIMEELALGLGDTIEVYKANMIIPQIARNLTRSGAAAVPAACPVCQGPTAVRQISDARALYCPNPDCQAKHVKSFTLLVSRDALNIEGLSEATLTKFIFRGFIREYADIFHLQRYRNEIEELEGFGERSLTNLLASVEKARHTTLSNLIYGLGIENVGLANAKLICREFDHDLAKLRAATYEELVAINTIGDVIARGFVAYFQDEKRQAQLDRLVAELQLEKPEGQPQAQIFAGLNFVITGTVAHFAGRKELKEEIEKFGGKVTGSVTSKTNYLINNDVNSASSKNQKAKTLGIPIISEDDYLELAKEKQE